VAGPFRFGSAFRDDRPLEIGVRPEHVRLVAGGAPAKVQLVEAAGTDAFAYLDVGGGRVVARVPADVRPQPGENVGVEVAERNVHVFDRETGDRIEWTR
jgi:ABC-type sugar transport system ATPase subunit